MTTERKHPADLALKTLRSYFYDTGTCPNWVFPLDVTDIMVGHFGQRMTGVDSRPVNRKWSRLGPHDAEEVRRKAREVGLI